MRPLVQDEKRQAIKYGEKYEYPVIFEKHKIRIKWEDSKIVQHTPPTPLKETKPVSMKISHLYLASLFHGHRYKGESR